MTVKGVSRDGRVSALWRLASLLLIGATLFSLRGLPVGRIEVLWLSALAAIVAFGPPRFIDNALTTAARDGLMVIAAFYLFDYLQATITSSPGRSGETYGLLADRWLTGGEPTVWLQQHLYGDHYRTLWNLPLTAVYLSHFWLPYLFLVFAWIRNRKAFYLYALTALVLSYSSLAVYWLWPTAPPWFDSEHLLGGPVARTSTIGLAILHVPIAPVIVSLGRRNFDQFAAFPSLHAGYALIPLLATWSGSRGRVRAAWAAYAVAMGFTVVATGEHWLVDDFGTWVIVLLSFAASQYALRFSRQSSASLLNSRTDVAPPSRVIITTRLASRWLAGWPRRIP
jgi:hypothetical protein